MKKLKVVPVFEDPDLLGLSVLGQTTYEYFLYKSDCSKSQDGSAKCGLNEAVRDKVLIKEGRVRGG